jgi:hypothetical protein
MTRRLPPASACLLLCTAAFAGPPAPAVPPDAPSAAYGTQRLHFRPEIQISVGGVRVELEKTSLVQLQKALGGTIAQSGDPGELTFGLCYVMRSGDRRSRLWLLSDEDMGADHVVDSALASRVDAGEAIPSNCIEPAGATSLKVQDTAVGAPLPEVQARLGKGSRQKGGWLGYSFNARAGIDQSEFIFVAIGHDEKAVSDVYVAKSTGGSED